MLIEFSLMRIGLPLRGRFIPAESDGYRHRLGKSGKKSTQKKKKEERRASERKEREEGKKKIEENVMQSEKPCRSPFLRGHASY